MAVLNDWVSEAVKDDMCNCDCYYFVSNISQVLCFLLTPNKNPF